MAKPGRLLTTPTAPAAFGDLFKLAALIDDKDLYLGKARELKQLYDDAIAEVGEANAKIEQLTALETDIAAREKALAESQSAFASQHEAASKDLSKREAVLAAEKAKLRQDRETFTAERDKSAAEIKERLEQIARREAVLTQLTDQAQNLKEAADKAIARADERQKQYEDKLQQLKAITA